MKIVAIVVEYNPFHNGHFYQLNKIKSELNPDGIICIMSGNFIQRGEPAVFDKWARAEMALKGGADIVIELPVCFCTSTAEIFAESSIRLMNRLGVVTTISFGIEKVFEKELFSLAEILAKEPEALKSSLKKYLKYGMSFAAAREKALLDLLSGKNLQLDAIKFLLNNPNSILAIEYLKAIFRTGSKIEIYPVIRKGASYTDETLRENFSSATSIRNYLFKKGPQAIDDLARNLPDFCLEIMKREITLGRGPVSLKQFEQIILFNLRKMDPYELKSVFDVVEGLENRIVKIARQSTNLDELIAGIKSKRYTATKIQRLLIHSILRIDKELVMKRTPLYIRVLGFTKKGALILKKIQQVSNLPVITRASQYKGLKSDAQKMFETDLRASDIHCLAFENPIYRKGRQDFDRQIIISNF